MKQPNGLLLIGVGAALMYFFDPQGGRRRRALLRDQYVHTMRKVQEARRVVVRDASHRATGLIAQANRLVKPGAGPDEVVLVERVRAALGRAVSHPHAIEVSTDEGHITLRGAVLAAEVDNLVQCVNGVPGVRFVANRLSVFDEPGNIPLLQGGTGREGARVEWMQRNWSPSARAVAGAFGAGFAMFGLFRGGMRGLALGAIGSGLLARATTNREIKSLVGAGVPIADAVGRALAKADLSSPPPGVQRH